MCAVSRCEAFRHKRAARRSISGHIPRSNGLRRIQGGSVDNPCRHPRLPGPACIPQSNAHRTTESQPRNGDGPGSRCRGDPPNRIGPPRPAVGPATSPNAAAGAISGHGSQAERCSSGCSRLPDPAEIRTRSAIPSDCRLPGKPPKSRTWRCRRQLSPTPASSVPTTTTTAGIVAVFGKPAPGAAATSSWGG